MRQRRQKAPASFPVAQCHFMSRVVNRDFVFGSQEREHFVRLLREYELFCGVRVLTYCILSNHFHLLVEVPARPAQPLTAEEVLDRIEGLSSSALTPGLFQQRLEQFRAAGDAAGERSFLDRTFRGDRTPIGVWEASTNCCPVPGCPQAHSGEGRRRARNTPKSGGVLGPSPPLAAFDNHPPPADARREASRQTRNGN